MAKSYEPLKLLVIARILNAKAAFTHRMELFMHLRNMCGNTLPKKVNSSENMCCKSSSGLCGMDVCPLLNIPWISKQ